MVIPTDWAEVPGAPAFRVLAEETPVPVPRLVSLAGLRAGAA